MEELQKQEEQRMAEKLEKFEKDIDEKLNKKQKNLEQIVNKNADHLDTVKSRLKRLKKDKENEYRQNIVKIFEEQK